MSPEEEEKDREELYKAIGYSPDEDFVEYPKDVSLLQPREFPYRQFVVRVRTYCNLVPVLY